MGDEIIEFDAGWVVLQEGIEKIKRTLEGSPEPPFTAEESMKLYTLTYNMCIQSPPYDFSSQIYYKCQKAFEEYITLNVSPSLIEKHDEFLLRELVFRWGKHKEMIRWMTHIFKYINRHFVFGRELPPLREVGQTCFNDMVYKVVIPKVKDTVIALIVKEREGDQIDRVLLKDTLDILDEIGKYNYERDFEPYMLQETGAYYSRKASSWIEQDSCPEYMFKSEECLNKERDRVSHYLHLTSEMKLLDKVRHELLVVQANRLIEKVDSGCRALLEDGKREDLCRMYRLYLQIPEGLDPVADIFRQHVTAEGIALVQQAELVATALNARDVNESALINKLLMLNAKYMVYVTECFQKNSQFRKALKEAFSEIYNRSVTGQFLSEGVLVALCDTVLKMKLSDEDIEMKD